MPLNDLVAITCYFNPMGFQRRRDNYRAFRDRLAARLVTVELYYGAHGELSEGDADTLIQIRTESDQVLWQKERLLNIALGALPDDCRFVAWVDCDLVFGRADWAEATAAVLENAALAQPYSLVHDLDKDADLATLETASRLHERRSMAARHLGGGIDFGAMSTNCMGEHSPGHAWAARREVLDCGLYDAMILGSGDHAIAMAAIGRWENIVAAYAMNDRQAAHYRAWAQRFHANVRGRIGLVDGDLYHLWHGALEHRGYDWRYPAIQDLDFDPESDLVLARNGAWQWSPHKPRLHRVVREYFGSRKEDG